MMKLLPRTMKLLPWTMKLLPRMVKLHRQMMRLHQLMMKQRQQMMLQPMTVPMHQLKHQEGLGRKARVRVGMLVQRNQQMMARKVRKREVRRRRRARTVQMAARERSQWSRMMTR
mmetsp:Transcript_5833/g.11801  ORF Transcript_5833/g.11801 Transcript_5833/m.11801 type:complete len:115 (+) Transcript_5833:248-592(+)